MLSFVRTSSFGHVTTFLCLEEFSSLRDTCKTLQCLPKPTEIPVRLVVHWSLSEHPRINRYCTSDTLLYVGWLPDTLSQERIYWQRCNCIDKHVAPCKFVHTFTYYVDPLRKVDEQSSHIELTNTEVRETTSSRSISLDLEASDHAGLANVEIVEMKEVSSSYSTSLGLEGEAPNHTELVSVVRLPTTLRHPKGDSYTYHLQNVHPNVRSIVQLQSAQYEKLAHSAECQVVSIMARNMTFEVLGTSRWSSSSMPVYVAGNLIPCEEKFYSQARQVDCVDECCWNCCKSPQPHTLRFAVVEQEPVVYRRQPMHPSLFNLAILDRITRFLTLSELSIIRDLCKTYRRLIPDACTIPVRLVVHQDRLMQVGYTSKRLCYLYIGWFPDEVHPALTGCDKCRIPCNERVTLIPIRTTRKEEKTTEDQPRVNALHIDYLRNGAQQLELVNDQPTRLCNYAYGHYEITGQPAVRDPKIEHTTPRLIIGSVLCQQDRFYTDSVTVSAGQTCEYCGSECTESRTYTYDVTTLIPKA